MKRAPSPQASFNQQPRYQDYEDAYNSDASSSSVDCGGLFSLIARSSRSSSSTAATYTRTTSLTPDAATSSTPSKATAVNKSNEKGDPESKEYREEAEALVVKELTQLSLKERNVIEEEIHGVGDETMESPELIKQSLAAFEIELSKLVTKSNSHHSSPKTSAYQQALAQSPAYVHDTKLQLQFLRAERFDSNKAARRFLKYFEAILDFFGPQCLTKEITWDDLSEADRDCVNTCSFMVDQRDQRGRRLAWIFPQYEYYHNYKNQIRNVWYQIMKALKDEETQRKGFIKVVYALGGDTSRMKKPTSTMDTELFFKGIHLIFEVLPFRLAALHYCFEDPKIRPVIATVQYVIGKAGRLRFRAHYGSHVECQYALMTFGIPKKHIPISDGGDVPASMDKFHDYLQELRKGENSSSNNTNTPPPPQLPIVSPGTPPISYSSSPPSGVGGDLAKAINGGGKKGRKKKTASNSSLVSNASSVKSSSSADGDDSGVQPTPNDVLLGRGKPFQEYPGNLRLAILVDRYRERYMEAGRCDKAIISQHLVDQIKKADGRFLKKLTSDGPWTEVTDEVARDKVGHGFRTKPRKIFNPVPLKSSYNSNNGNNSIHGNNMINAHPNNMMGNNNFHPNHLNNMNNMLPGRAVPHPMNGLNNFFVGGGVMPDATMSQNSNHRQDQGSPFL